jgi:enamine deaminase RidA (YjgF/YER057c/UK114 family)
MAISRVTSPASPEPRPGLWSNCLLIDGIAYVSGLTARGGDFVTIDGADEYAQTKIIFTKMKGLIEAAGGRMSDMAKLTIFVTNIKNREQVWKARAEFFEGNFPACSLVEVRSLASPEILVEIEGIAHIGKST